MRKIAPTEPIKVNRHKEALARLQLNLPRTISCSSLGGCNQKFIVESTSDVYNGPISGLWVFCPHCGCKNYATYQLGFNSDADNSIAPHLKNSGVFVQPFIEWWRRVSGYYD